MKPDLNVEDYEHDRIVTDIEKHSEYLNTLIFELLRRTADENATTPGGKDWGLKPATSDKYVKATRALTDLDPVNDTK
jgi:hypothetical protein